MTGQLVSVVIPTRNRATRVTAAIASVEQQTWPSWELIVVDDGSGDDTPSVLAAIAERNERVRVVRHGESRGGSAARNHGIDVARGDLLAFLDDDDEWLPTKLTEQIDYLDAHPDVAAVSCWHAIDDGDPLGPALFRGPTSVTRRDLYWDNFLGSASFCMLRRDAFVHEPRFDVTLPSAQDWDVWLQCATQGRVAVVPQVLCRYGAHGDARITGSSPARIDGRCRIIDRHSGAMSDDCRAYNHASVALIGVDSPSAEGKVLASLVREGHAGAAWALTSAAIAGRLGDRVRDPARGARQLHRVIRRLDR